jgi:Predicted solute binding protein
MKTSTLKSALAAFTLMFLSTQINAQDLVGTRIDVQGSRYSDQMWMFSVPTCTRDYDNGWDGYKMFGTSTAIPQIFAVEASGNYQIDAIPTFNDTYISFKAGEDSVYTLTFTNQLVETIYSHLYLVDSVANKTIDIFNSGTTYTFNVKPTAQPVKRFKIVSVLPTAVTPPATTTTTDPIVTTTDPTTTTTTPPTTTVDTTVVAPTDTKKGKEKSIKIKSSKKDLVITNNKKEKGWVKVYNATTGKMMKSYDLNTNTTSTITTDLPTGTYIVNATTTTTSVNETVLIN